MNPPQASKAPPPADPKQQVIEQLKTSTNVLLTVSESPTVDQLAAVIGMTLLLNKMGKHATAVFSGQIPSTIEFLQPEKTIETTTDSLRDFIISLDKSKADKLRYKIEDKFVKIFITPYHTSLSEKDLVFSQGDFNVDVVLALGVKRRDELDQTIMAHGRILHDATVISVNNTPGGDLGAIAWTQTNASSLSEMLAGLAENLQSDQPKLLDQQIATCFLTGIVAQTDRFSNAKTSPQTMSLAAKLMNAGANQQLIATKLQPPTPIQQEPPAAPPPPAPKPPEPPKPISPPMPTPSQPPVPPAPAAVLPPVPSPKPASPTPPAPQPPKPPEPPKPTPPPAPTQVKVAEPTPTPVEKKTESSPSPDGSLSVPHDSESSEFQGATEDAISRIHIDDQGMLKQEEEIATAPAEDTATPAAPESALEEGRKVIDAPPALGSDLNSSSQPQPPQADSSAMNLPEVKNPLLDSATAPAVQPPAGPPSPPPLSAPPAPGQSLSDLEKSVNSPHLRKEDSQSPAEELPVNLIGPDTGLPPDKTAGSPSPAPPPPVPPPIPMAAPPAKPLGPTNLSNPNSGVPL